MRFSVNEIWLQILKTLRRFPVVSVWAFAAASYAVWFTEYTAHTRGEFKYVKPILTGILGISWLIGFRLFSRFSRRRNDKRTGLLMLVPLALLAVYYFTLPETMHYFPYSYVLYLIAGHLFVTFAPVLRINDRAVFWNYLKTLAESLIKSLFFSMVIFAGISLALLALDLLFHLPVRDRLYGELFIFVAFVVHTGLFLAHLDGNIISKKINFPVLLENFARYVLIPLVLLYLIILYSYEIKILLQWELPRGWVSVLIIILALLGFAVHLIIEPVAKHARSLMIRRFVPLFYYAMLPVLPLLFAALYRRLSDYGLTEARYMILALDVWIALIILYMLISRKRNLKLLPVSWVCIALLISFGPWGILQAGIKSQTARFGRIFHRIQAENFTISQSEYNNLQSVLTYLSERNATDRIAPLLGYNPGEKFPGANSWKLAQNITDSLHISIKDKDLLGWQFVIFFLPNGTNVPTAGYDYILFHRIMDYIPPESDKPPLTDSYHLSYETETKRFYIMKNNDTMQRISIADYLKGLPQKGGAAGLDTLSFEKENENMRSKLIFHRLEYIKKRDSSYRIENADITLLIKEKP